MGEILLIKGVCVCCSLEMLKLQKCVANFPVIVTSTLSNDKKREPQFH